MDGLRFERRSEEDYYKVILHVGSTYVPISDEDVEELKKKSKLLGGQFLEFFMDRIGYSSYLKDQIKAELLKIGTPTQQLSMLRRSLQEL